jgi:transposase
MSRPEKRTHVVGAVPLFATQAPNPEVREKAKRRTFTAEYKLRILEEVDRALTAKDSGKVGEVLRREGLYSSHLTEWRRERREGALAGLAKKRGRKASRRRDAVALEADQLRREVADLRRRLEQAELIIEVQKKVSALLGIPLRTVEDEESGS